ncbi:MAG: 30S ribosome-binding factor RbfA [Verrucomicrobia bacterium]|jgi:ribosome-binding factor A|nr:30S ribosome-binding factor RbfA [Verrucomicrobiota bacterium]
MSQRIKRVSELLKRELSSVLEKHYRFDGVILTVHDVEATPDLKQSFAYIGILGTGINKDFVIEKLNKNRGAIQREVHKRIVMKNSPQIFFRLDQSVERGVRILNAIDSLPPPADPLPEGEEEAKMG